jgi:hypothetical protein
MQVIAPVPDLLCHLWIKEAETLVGSSTWPDFPEEVRLGTSGLCAFASVRRLRTPRVRSTASTERARSPQVEPYPRLRPIQKTAGQVRGLYCGLKISAAMKVTVVVPSFRHQWVVF